MLTLEWHVSSLLELPEPHVRHERGGAAGPEQVGIPSSRATPSAKLISIVGSTQVTGGRPGVALSSAMRSLSGAAQRVLVDTARPRP